MINIFFRLDLLSTEEGPESEDNTYLGYSLALGHFDGEEGDGDVQRGDNDDDDDDVEHEDCDGDDDDVQPDDGDDDDVQPADNGEDAKDKNRKRHPNCAPRRQLPRYCHRDAKRGKPYGQGRNHHCHQNIITIVVIIIIYHCRIRHHHRHDHHLHLLCR